MTESAKTDRSVQWLVCLCGFVLLYVGADAALDSYLLGHLQFVHKRSVFTGPVAGFLIVSFLLVGSGFVGTSIRNLERR